MRTFKGTVAPNKPTEGQIAAEYFNISVAVEDTAPPTEKDEKRIILTADFANEHQYWGEPDNATMFANVGKVDVFLQKTGLEYQQLLALLDLKFINPASDIAIVHLIPLATPSRSASKRWTPPNSTASIVSFGYGAS